MKSTDLHITEEELQHRHEAVPADYYDQGVASNVWQKIWHRERRRIIERYLRGRAGPLLDLGCHGGYLTRIIAAVSGAKVTGMDISSEATAYAAARQPQATFITQDIQQPWPLPDSSFSTVTAFDVLEHIPKVSNVLKEVSRVLSPGGQLIIGVPRETIVFRLVWAWWTKARGMVWEDVHVHAFNGQELAKLAEQYQMQMQEQTLTHWGMYQVMVFHKGDN